MRFRPCIDIHNGKVKQIVGGSLTDREDFAEENFVSERAADWFAKLYKRDGLRGGHIIMLNGAGSPYYEATREQAYRALRAWPGGMQAGGGVNPDNACDFLNAGASHVIVTSYVFSGGAINMDNLERMRSAVGRERLVLDLSCRRHGDGYCVATDRWQKLTDVRVTKGLLSYLADYCGEFLVHAVDVEGRSSGIERDLVQMLGSWDGIPITYAGGVGSLDDVETLRELGQGRLDVTVGSALDLFGGCIPYRNMVYLT